MKLGDTVSLAVRNLGQAKLRTALTTWFDTAIRKSQETYKADAKTLSYMIAAAATVTLNMFPQFDDVPMRTYLMVLAKMRRPSATPSASWIVIDPPAGTALGPDVTCNTGAGCAATSAITITGSQSRPMKSMSCSITQNV